MKIPISHSWSSWCIYILRRFQLQSVEVTARIQSGTNCKPDICPRLCKRASTLRNQYNVGQKWQMMLLHTRRFAKIILHQAFCKLKQQQKRRVELIQTISVRSPHALLRSTMLHFRTADWKSFLLAANVAQNQAINVVERGCCKNHSKMHEFQNRFLFCAE